MSEKVYKSVADLEIVEEAAEQDCLLVEREGSLKRISAEKIGGGSNSLEPFVLKIDPEAMTWDATQMDSLIEAFNSGRSCFIRISDNTLYKINSVDGGEWMVVLYTYDGTGDKTNSAIVLGHSDGTITLIESPFVSGKMGREFAGSVLGIDENGYVVPKEISEENIFIGKIGAYYDMGNWNGFYLMTPFEDIKAAHSSGKYVSLLVYEGAIPIEQLHNIEFLANSISAYFLNEGKIKITKSEITYEEPNPVIRKKQGTAYKGQILCVNDYGNITMKKPSDVLNWKPLYSEDRTQQLILNDTVTESGSGDIIHRHRHTGDEQPSKTIIKINPDGYTLDNPYLSFSKTYSNAYKIPLDKTKPVIIEIELSKITGYTHVRLIYIGGIDSDGSTILPSTVENRLVTGTDQDIYLKNFSVTDAGANISAYYQM